MYWLITSDFETELFCIQWHISFISCDTYFIQEKCVAKGLSLFGLLSDVYLNYYENTYLLSNNNNNKLQNKIIFYTFYVDNTFVVFNGTLRQIDNLGDYLNNVNKHI